MWCVWSVFQLSVEKNRLYPSLTDIKTLSWTWQISRNARRHVLNSERALSLAGLRCHHCHFWPAKNITQLFNNSFFGRRSSWISKERHHTVLNWPFWQQRDWFDSPNWTTELAMGTQDRRLRKEGGRSPSRLNHGSQFEGYGVQKCVIMWWRLGITQACKRNGFRTVHKSP